VTAPAGLRLYRVGRPAPPGEPRLPETWVWAADREGACRLWREGRWAARGPELVGDERLVVFALLPARGEGAPDWEAVWYRPRGAAPEDPPPRLYRVRPGPPAVPAYPSDFWARSRAEAVEAWRDHHRALGGGGALRVRRPLAPEHLNPEPPAP
jgi:hypothetical protein